MDEGLIDKVNQAALAVARQWPDTIDADDLGQEIWIRLLESPGSMEKLLDMGPGQRLKALTAMGHQIASKEREDYATFHGNFHYSTQHVRLLLEGAMKALSGSGTTDPHSELGNELIDLSTAVAQVSDGHRAMLRRAFVDDDELDSTDRKTLTRAVDSVTTVMNRAFKKAAQEYTGVGSRKVISNESSQKVLHSQHEELGVKK